MSSMKKSWPVIRMLLFLVVGFMNTVLIRPEDVGTWKNYLGYALLLLGIIDAVLLARKYFNKKKTDR